jgi:excisionase family DNA binding protein
MEQESMLTDVMTVSEVAEYLRVNPQTVYRKAKAGELPAVRIGRAIRFRKAELDEWMKAFTTKDEVKV